MRPASGVFAQKLRKFATKKHPGGKILRGDSLVGPFLSFLGVRSGFSCSGSCLSGSDLPFALESPTDFVALGRGAGLADGAGDGAFVGTAAAHFFENAFGIELGFQALEGAVDALSTFDFNAASMFFHDKIPLGPAGSGKLGGWRGRVKPAFSGKFVGCDRGARGFGPRA
jgi:hypothetical protein